MARKRPSEGEADDRQYHVVGTRTDGTIAVMGSGLSMEEAKRVRASLIEANIFPVIQIKRGDPKKTCD